VATPTGGPRKRYPVFGQGLRASSRLAERGTPRLPLRGARGSAARLSTMALVPAMALVRTQGWPSGQLRGYPYGGPAEALPVV
jgi:hypothetical protein